MSMTTAIDFRDFARDVGTVMDYREGDVVFREGDAPRYMYMVLTGSVDIIARGRVLETIGAGNAPGIVALLDDEPRTTTARATEPFSLAIIDRKKFRYMIEEMPNFCWHVMGELAHRLRRTNAAL